MGSEKTNWKSSILLFPWLAHGHISPFLELAKTFSNRNFHIYFCSTCVNLDSIKPKLPSSSSSSIELVELHLPYSDEFPPHLHTMKGLPSHLLPTLKDAFSNSAQNFHSILKTLQPDLIIYDSFQPWAPQIASSLNIPSITYINTGSYSLSMILHVLHNPSSPFPFPELFFSHQFIDNSYTSIDEVSASDIPEQAEDFMKCFYRSRDVILINSFRELEGKYLDYSSLLSNKKLIPIGPLIQQPNENQEEEEEDGHSNIIKWLDKKEPFSTVFVSFGSEFYPSKQEMEEIAYGLESSDVNFIWVVRFSKGDGRNEAAIEEALPQGFVERVRNRGMVVKEWAPQIKILKHGNIGGFVSHCGWNSMMESLIFGVPIIGMPIKVDQPLNARLVETVGVGIEVKRDKQGKIQRHEIGRVIREVVAEKSGESVRKKAREMGQFLSGEREGKMDEAVVEISSLILEKSAATDEKIKSVYFG